MPMSKEELIRQMNLCFEDFERAKKPNTAISKLRDDRHKLMVRCGWSYSRFSSLWAEVHNSRYSYAEEEDIP